MRPCRTATTRRTSLTSWRTEKRETEPYKGNGVLGGVKVGDEITYEIRYKNYKTEAADVVIKDRLDQNVVFVSADPEGEHSGEESGGEVVWTIEDVEAGETGTVSLTVKVLQGALESNGGKGKVSCLCPLFLCQQSADLCFQGIWGDVRVQTCLLQLCFQEMAIPLFHSCLLGDLVQYLHFRLGQILALQFRKPFPQSCIAISLGQGGH